MEIWKTIDEFENYQVSNLGNIKSSGRTVLRNGNLHHLKEKFLKQNIDGAGYLSVCLHKNSIGKTKKVHQLVAIAFLNHKPNGYNLVINHKDFNRLNNNLGNLEVVTHRENTSKKHLKSTSEYTGVYWNKLKNKWHAQIYINSKSKHLGYFNNEIEASNAYKQNVIKSEII